MSKHASKPYNPGIANVFYLAGYIKSQGRGLEKICNACQEEGTPQPEFSINPEDITIKFTAAENRIIRSVTPSVTEKVTERVTESIEYLIDTSKIAGCLTANLKCLEGERKSLPLMRWKKWLNYMVYPQVSCLVAQKQNTLPNLLSRSLWNSSTL